MSWYCTRDAAAAYAATPVDCAALIPKRIGVRHASPPGRSRQTGVPVAKLTALTEWVTPRVGIAAAVARPWLRSPTRQGWTQPQPTPCRCPVVEPPPPVTDNPFRILPPVYVVPSLGASVIHGLTGWLTSTPRMSGESSTSTLWYCKTPSYKVGADRLESTHETLVGPGAMLVISDGDTA